VSWSDRSFAQRIWLDSSRCRFCSVRGGLDEVTVAAGFCTSFFAFSWPFAAPPSIQVHLSSRPIACDNPDQTAHCHIHSLSIINVTCSNADISEDSFGVLVSIFRSMTHPSACPNCLGSTLYTSHCVIRVLASHCRVLLCSLNVYRFYCVYLL
jgi:hypothetical protein